MGVLPPGRKYEEISDTERRQITINHAVCIDASHYAHEMGLTFSKFMEQAAIREIRRVQRLLKEPKYTPAEWNEKHDRFINRVLQDSEFIQSGIFERQQLDEAKKKFAEEGK